MKKEKKEDRKNISIDKRKQTSSIEVQKNETNGQKEKEYWAREDYLLEKALEKKHEREDEQ